MDRDEFDGTLVLEKLAEIDKVDDFFDAVDSDNYQAARSLMKLAKIDFETIETVIEKMKEAEGEHG